MSLRLSIKPDFVPTQDFVLLRPLPLPEECAVFGNAELDRFEVVAVGPGGENAEGWYHESQARVGQTVYAPLPPATKLQIAGHDYVLTRDGCIFGRPQTEAERSGEAEDAAAFDAE